MSNGSSVLDESASALFVYDAPEIERSKVLFEEIWRSFDGNDMQDKYDQMLLFEKLREGLFDDMILIGLCMHAMVCWKRDDQQLFRTVERQKVSVPTWNRNGCFKSNSKTSWNSASRSRRKLYLYDK